MKTLKEFTERANLPASLIRAVVRQLGRWSDFKEAASDIANHGADGGWCGFTCYSDTVPFGKKHKADILRMAEDQAQALGAPSVYGMIANFRCMNGLTEVEVAKALHNPRADDDDKTTVFNGLAWYALEEVARAYDDLNND